MKSHEITDALFSHQDIKYRVFQTKLVPNIDAQTIIGVRIPVIRNLAKQVEDPEAFLSELPHRYYDEYILHDCLVNRERSFDKAVAYVNALLPFIDNWATCDILSPASFKKNPEKLIPLAMEWARSEKTYTMRFGVEMLMSHCLGTHFSKEQSDLIASLRPEDYYGKMMIAWYFATALAKQYDAVLPYLQRNALDRWTHNKTIQKAVESFRIFPEQKEYLRTLRLK